MLLWSSAMPEFWGIVQGVSEFLCLLMILEGLKIEWHRPMRLFYDNKSAISIRKNLINMTELLKSTDTLSRRNWKVVWFACYTCLLPQKFLLYWLKGQVIPDFRCNCQAGSGQYLFVNLSRSVEKYILL